MIRHITLPVGIWDRAIIAWLGILAILMIVLASMTKVLLSGDSIIWYGPAVQGLLNGEGYKAFAGDTFRGPFFPFSVYLVATMLGGRIFEAGIIVGIIAYLLFVTGVFFATRAAFTAKIAFLLSIAVGLNATVLFNSVEWLTDMTFAALGILSLYLMLRDFRRLFWLGPILAGICGGLALTTRWNGAYLLFVAVLHPVANPLKQTGLRRLLWPVGYMVGFVLAASPWFWINWQLHGSPLYNTSYVTGFHPALVSPQIPPGSSLVNTILGDPVFFIVHYLRRLFWDGWSDVSQLVPVPLLLFAPAGLVVWLFTMNRRKLWYATYFFVFWGIASLTHFEPRFYLILLPAVLICPILFFLSDIIPDRLVWNRKVSLKLVGVLVLLIGIGWVNYRAVVERVHGDVAARISQVEASEWLARERANETVTTIATRFFSGARYFIPANSGSATTTLASAGEYLSPPATISHVFVEEGLPDPVHGEIDPSMFSLSSSNPLLEAVYFKPDTPRAVLYRVLLSNQVITPIDVIASSVLNSAHAARFAIDGDSTTSWLSALQVTPETTTTLTIDMGTAQEVNRVWVLPASATTFPQSFNIQISVDGQEWQVIAGFDDYPLVERKDPQIFAFETARAQFVRIAGAVLRPNAEGEYQMGFAEVRVSRATERNSTPYEFAAPEFTFDSASGRLETCAKNVGTTAGPVQVTLTIDRDQPILLESAAVSAQQSVCFHVPLALIVSPGTHLVQTEVVGPKSPNRLWRQKQELDVPALQSLEQWQNENLLPNGGLESQGDGWLIQAPVHFDSDVKHGGGTSLRVDKADFAAPNFYHVGTPSVALSPTVPYVFGGWIKTKDLQENPALVAGTSKGLAWAQPQPSISFDAYQYGKGTQDWAMWSGKLTSADPEQTSLTLFVNDFRNGSVWLDDVFVLPLYTTTVQ